MELAWQRDGTVCLVANNGSKVGIKKTGPLFANCAKVEKRTKYFFYLVNRWVIIIIIVIIILIVQVYFSRTVLVLSCQQGFLGYFSSNLTKLTCNKPTYDSFQVVT